MTVLQGDCLTLLPTLPAGLVNACVTSPPYYGLRDYDVPATKWPALSYLPMSGLPAVAVPAMTCALGLEPTPEAYIGHLVLIFREVRRTLTADGAMLLNIGDSYAGSAKNTTRTNTASTVKQGPKLTAMRSAARPALGQLPAKNMLGIPWRLAFALQADGWILRQDIIWSKPNPMPESVKDRCTKAHEYVFLLSKQKRYYWDALSLAEPLAESSQIRLGQDLESQAGSSRVPGKTNGPMKAVSRDMAQTLMAALDRGSTFTSGKTASHQQDRAGQTERRPQLVRALELAEEHGLSVAHLDALRAVGLSNAPRRSLLNTGAGGNRDDVQQLADEAHKVLGSYAQEFLIGTTANPRSVWTIATTPFKEAHFAVMSAALAERAVLAITPPGGTVLDPFLGSGTTGKAALKHGREFLGIELHPQNVTLSRKQLHRAQPGLALLGAL